MFGLFQSTPSYVGDGQPSAGCTGGIGLGWLTGIFGFPGTPNYQGPSPQPTEPAPDPAPTGADPETPCEGAGTDANAAKLATSTSAIPIAIVIQRAD